MERLSGLDASFLYMETAAMHMHVSFVLVCDARGFAGGYSFPRVASLLEERTGNEPAFRRKLMQVPFNLDHPLWVIDEDFDISRHVVHEVLPAPGDRSALGRAIGRLMSVPLDRSRPLWEAHVIEGMQDNQFAIVLKIHHAAVDGVSGTALIKRLFDGYVVQQDMLATQVMPSRWALAREALRVRAREPKAMWRLARESVTRVAGMIRSRNGDDKVQRSAPMSAPHTHFNRRIGPVRDLALAEVSLEDIKRIKNAAGCTVNDVVLALCGGVLRDFLLQEGDLPAKSLTAMVPISVRTEAQKTEVNNHVSGMWSTLATHVADPMQRLRLIQADTAGAKEEFNAVGANLLQDWAEFNRPGTLSVAMKLYVASGLLDVVAPVHNTIISNLPGPRDPYFLGGARLEALFPIGPVMEGVGLNISLASYGDRVCFSIHVDAGLVPDPDRIAGLFPRHLAALQMAVDAPQNRVSMTDALRAALPASLYPA
jgi:diacylglycerol O-acyltransferase